MDDDDFKPTDDYGHCNACGGHGTLMRHVSGPVRIAQGGVYETVECWACKGKDTITPVIEAQAEESRG